MTKNNQEVNSEDKYDNWVWCLHCERCYKIGEFKTIAPDKTLKRAGITSDLQICPYEDCDGDAVFDTRLWKEIREIHPEYPIEPIKGINYPIY